MGDVGVVECEISSPYYLYKALELAMTRRLLINKRTVASRRRSTRSRPSTVLIRCAIWHQPEWMRVAFSY